ncbi:MAG: SH3 domain-containing protein [Spirochaetota bacterium]
MKNLKNLFILSFFILSLTPSKGLLADPICEYGKLMYAQVDNLRLRKKPNLNSKTIDYISEGDKLSCLGLSSKTKLRLKLRGESFYEPWIKVRTIYNTTGWVYKGGVIEYDFYPKPKLLFTGQFHGDEVDSKSGDSFLAVVERKNRYSLVPVNIRVKTVWDDIVKENTGKEVFIQGKKRNVLFMLRDLDLKPRSYIKTIPFDLAFEQITNKGIKIHPKSSYSIKVECPENGMCQTWLQKGKTRKSIYHYGGILSYVWVGDINGDGILDFLISYIEKVTETTILFLSTKHRNIFKIAAEFSHTGC